VGDANTGADTGSSFAILPVPTQLTCTDQNTTTGAPASFNFEGYYQPSSWCQTMVSLFNSIRVKRAELEWVPRCGTADRGNIIISHLKDVCDLVSDTTKLGSGASSRIGGGWSPSEVESTGSKSVSFPVWMSKKFPLPLSGKEAFYSSQVPIANSVDGTTTGAVISDINSARLAYPDGCFLVCTEGLSQVASDASPSTLSSYGHFRIHYGYDLMDPVPPKGNSNVPVASPLNKGVEVVASTDDVMKKLHKVRVFPAGLEDGSYKVDRSLLDRSLSPYGRVSVTPKTLKMPLSLDNTGSDMAIIFFEGLTCLDVATYGLRYQVIESMKHDYCIFAEQIAEEAGFIIDNDQHRFTVTVKPVDD
jgi:hypothetical protein